jgi:hypothetical protein
LSVLVAKKVRRVRKSRTSKGSATKRGSVQSGESYRANEASSKNVALDEGRDQGDQLSTEDELREEYAYVVRDLRRVAILAAAMFILLILINILLQ